MEAQRFDHLSRRLGKRLTRRGALAIAGAAAAAALAGGDAHAARVTCRNIGGSCTRGTQCCSGLCATGRDVPRGRRNRCFVCPADTLTCVSTCCPAGSACIDGACVTTCTPEDEDSLCVLSARSVIVADPCLRVMASGTRCIDDVDCSPSDYVTIDPGNDHTGCHVSFTAGTTIVTDNRGYCMSWTYACVQTPP